MSRNPSTLAALWLAICFALLSGAAQERGPAFRQVYIGEIGRLGTPYISETVVESVGMTISRHSYDSVLISGRDDAGKVWRVVARISGGVGFSEVWHGDLDANGRADLIVLHQFPKNGKCANDPHLIVVMSDSSGRPVPWEIDSDIDLRRALDNQAFEVGFSSLPPPGIFEFLDLNGNGRAEFVQTECFDGETSIRSVYEVEDARWRQLDTSQPKLGKADYARALCGLTFPPLPEPSEPYFIAEVGNTVSEPGPVVIARKIPRQGKCYAIPGPPAVNGTIPSDPHVWKVEEERNYRACNDGFVLDDGRTCFGYPAVVIDRPTGREAQMVGRSAEASALLNQLIEQRRPVILTGQTDEDHCSPAAIWALDE